MGANNSTNNLNVKEVEKQIKTYEHDNFKLFEDINMYCLTLSDRYKELLLDVNNSNKISIVLENSLKKTI